jgi:O-antigen/teichoic acid export membrane protein
LSAEPVTASLSYRTLFGRQARTLFGSSALVLIVGLVGNVSNYLYQFGMGRMLNVADFGTLNALLSLTTIVSVPASAITLFKAKHVARLVGEQGWGEVRLLYRRFLSRTLIFGGIASIAVAMFSGPLKDFFHIDGVWPVIIFSALIFCSLPVALNTGFFQGIQRFGTYAAIGSGTGIIRLVAAILLVWAGAALNGALLGIVLASLFVFVASYGVIRSLLRPYSSDSVKPLSTAGLSSTVLALLFLTLISFMDMVLVKHLYSAEQAGIYAGVSVLGRAILYFPAAITQVLLPKASRASRSDSHQLILASTLLTAALAVVGVLGFYFFSEPLLRIFLGSRYHGGSTLLAAYGLAMLFFAILTLFVNYCLARDIGGIYGILALIFVLEVSSVLFVQGTLYYVPFCLAGVGFLGCVLLLLRIRSETRSAALA